jgi:hypothetical protein
VLARACAWTSGVLEVGVAAVGNPRATAVAQKELLK